MHNMWPQIKDYFVMYFDHVPTFKHRTAELPLRAGLIRAS